MSEELRTADANMAEIARLTTEVRGLRAIVEQRDREIESERRARQMAQADAAKLRWALDGTTRMLTERSDNNSRAWIWARNVIEANQRALTDHPGASLLAELDAARAVVAQVRWAVANHYAPPPMYDALNAYDAAVKASEIT